MEKGPEETLGNSNALFLDLGGGHKRCPLWDNSSGYDFPLLYIILFLLYKSY